MALGLEFWVAGLFCFFPFFPIFFNGIIRKNKVAFISTVITHPLKSKIVNFSPLFLSFMPEWNCV